MTTNISAVVMAQNETSNISARAVECAQAVFDIPELLEAILLELPPTDIIVARHVQRIFAAVIQGFSSLQRRIYLLPSNTPAHFWQVNTSDRTFKTTRTRDIPIPVPTSNGSFGPVTPPPKFGEDYSLQVYRPNHALFTQTLSPRIKWEMERAEGIFSELDRHRLIVASADWAHRVVWSIGAARLDPSKIPAGMSNDSIWRRMFITSPPSEKALLVWSNRVGGNTVEVNAEMQRDDGLRVEDVIVAHRKLFQDHRAEVAKLGPVITSTIMVYPQYGIFLTEEQQEVAEKELALWTAWQNGGCYEDPKDDGDDGDEKEGASGDEIDGGSGFEIDDESMTDEDD